MRELKTAGCLLQQYRLQEHSTRRQRSDACRSGGESLRSVMLVAEKPNHNIPISAPFLDWLLCKGTLNQKRAKVTTAK